MTDERIREVLAAEAAEAPRAGDLWTRTTRRIRRRRLCRWGSAAVGVLAALVVVGGALAELDGRREVVLGDPQVPEGWRDVVVGEAVLSVPATWQVVDLTDVRPAQADPEVQPEEVHEDHAPVPAPVPCPTIDADRPALIHSRQALPSGCPDESEAFTGLAVVPLDAPAPWALRPAVLEAGERVEVGGVPARAVAAPLLTTSALSDAVAVGDATTLVAPGLGVHVEVRAGAHASAVEAVLETLRPRDAFEADAVLHSAGVYDAPSEAGHEHEFVGWAVDPDGRYHRWFHEPLDSAVRDAGVAFWPTPTAGRFGGIFHTEDAVRVVAARPGDGTPSVFALPEGVHPGAVAWSPHGEAAAWLMFDPEPRLAFADWGDPDRLADGADPERIDVALTGLPDREPRAALTLTWEDDDTAEQLLVHTQSDETYSADIRRHNGRLDLTDPLTFTRAGPRR